MGSFNTIRVMLVLVVVQATVLGSVCPCPHSRSMTGHTKANAQLVAVQQQRPVSNSSCCSRQSGPNQGQCPTSGHPKDDRTCPRCAILFVSSVEYSVPSVTVFHLSLSPVAFSMGVNHHADRSVHIWQIVRSARPADFGAESLRSLSCLFLV